MWCFSRYTRRVNMGKIQERIDSRKEAYLIAKVDIEMWLSEFVLEYSIATGADEKAQVVREWFG